MEPRKTQKNGFMEKLLDGVEVEWLPMKSLYDFKRLFTISEYYDRDRPTFYKKIQSVRENGMDMTGWLDYFITGLETRMIEVKERGEQVYSS